MLTSAIRTMDWPALEWEFLFQPRRCEIQAGGPLGEGWHSFTAKRNSDLDLVLELHGHGNIPSEGPAGTLVRADNIQDVAATFGNHRCSLRSAAVTQATFPGGSGIAHGVEVTYSDEPVAWQTYWLVNVENKDWPCNTERSSTSSYFRQRGISTPRRSTKGTRRSSMDHVAVEAAGFRFSFGNSKDAGCPGDWHPGFLEFVPVNGILPDEVAANTVIEFLRFLLGTETSAIGRTDFDQEDRVVRAVSHSRSLQVGHFRDSPSCNPPIPLAGPRLAECLAHLLPAYIQGRDCDNLFLALYQHAIGRRLPTPANVTQFATAMDLLRTGYYERHPEAARYVKSADFKLATAEIRAALILAVANFEGAREMVSKFDGQLNRRGDNEMCIRMVESLGLELSVAERSALRFRNRAVHGQADADDWEPAYWHGAVFETLLMRVFLRILGYSGRYIDYATPSWPERNVVEPCAPHHQ